MPSLQGILIFDGKSFTLHSDLPDPSAKTFSAVVPEDANHMLVGAPRGRLYRVDTRTLAAEAVAEPASNPFRFIQSIYHAGRATYIVSVDGSMPVAERRGEGRIGDFWQLQDGEWKRLVNGIDMRPTTPQRLGSLVPRDSGRVMARRLWNRTLVYPDGARRASTHRLEIWLLARRIGRGHGASRRSTALGRRHQWQHGLWKHRGEAGGFAGRVAVAGRGTRTLNPLRALVPDSRNHLWGFLSGDKNAISEWDGKIWTDHALPEDFSHRNLWNYGVDSQDRIWLVYNRCRGPVAILDPRRENAETFPEFSAALQAQLPNRASFHVEGNRFTVASFSPDGQSATATNAGRRITSMVKPGRHGSRRILTPANEGDLMGRPFSIAPETLP